MTVADIVGVVGLLLLALAMVLAWRRHRHHPVLPSELRAASHELANEVTKLQASKSADVLRGLIKDMRDDK